ncbi:Zinc finger E-box-binding homeobox like [Heracleum sosnowskyi]|uniref:Zinc finger E-box-binding homeobox like n=1 Tax=Heracleum sosnowskyi TaxID=360622 RepID=A0AAD8JGT3_9APIA|nr:Zinc finger E-box-binding homeobox like [Heracleum sosnowskyi]
MATPVPSYISDHQTQPEKPKEDDEESSLKIYDDNEVNVKGDQTKKSCTSSEEAALMQVVPVPAGDSSNRKGSDVGDESGRERLKRHRIEMGGQVWVPDTWGQENLLKNWIDCTAFDASLGNNTILSARAALMQQRRSTTNNLNLRRRIENRC